MISKYIQNSLIAFAMACSLSAWFTMANFSLMTVKIFNVPVIWLVLFIISLFVAEDIRRAFKKVLWFEKRDDKRPIWQVGIGAIFFITQISFVETFMRNWMTSDLGGMPLYIVFSFLNAFLLTVIYEEIFYVEKQNAPRTIKNK